MRKENDFKILEQLYDGNYLDEKDLSRANGILYALNIELKLKLKAVKEFNEQRLNAKDSEVKK